MHQMFIVFRIFKNSGNLAGYHTFSGSRRSEKKNILPGKYGQNHNTDHILAIIQILANTFYYIADTLS